MFCDQIEEENYPQLLSSRKKSQRTQTTWGSSFADLLTLCGKSSMHTLDRRFVTKKRFSFTSVSAQFSPTQQTIFRSDIEDLV